MSRIEQISRFLYREARYLDDKQWEKWLACYHPQASFWMPSWDDDGSLVTDPQREISLIYYTDRQGRTSHNISNVEILAEEGAKLTVRFNWLTFSFRYHTTHTYYGCSEYDLDVSGNEPLITRKYVVLKNDYINQVIDVYHV